MKVFATTQFPGCQFPTTVVIEYNNKGIIKEIFTQGEKERFFYPNQILDLLVSIMPKWLYYGSNEVNYDSNYKHLVVKNGNYEKWYHLTHRVPVVWPKTMPPYNLNALVVWWRNNRKSMEFLPHQEWSIWKNE